MEYDSPDAWRAEASHRIGRYRKGSKDAFGKKGEGPCNYTTGGLINISPIKVNDGANTQYVFAFAESTHAAA